MSEFYSKRDIVGLLYRSWWNSFLGLVTTKLIQIFIKYDKKRLNYSFAPYICQVMPNWSSNFLLSQFGPCFCKNDSIWSVPLILTKRC